MAQAWRELRRAAVHFGECGAAIAGTRNFLAMRQFGRRFQRAEAALKEGRDAIAVVGAVVVGRTGLARIGKKLRHRQRAGQTIVGARQIDAQAKASLIGKPLRCAAEVFLVAAIVVAIVVGVLLAVSGIEREAVPALGHAGPSTAQTIAAELAAHAAADGVRRRSLGDDLYRAAGGAVAI